MDVSHITHIPTPKLCKAAQRLRRRLSRRISLLIRVRNKALFRRQAKQESSSAEECRLSVVPEEYKETLDLAFGVEFYESLIKWPTISLQAIYLVDHLDKMRTTFGTRNSTEHEKDVPNSSLIPYKTSIWC